MRNLLRRFNVTSPKARFDEREDFFIVVIESYILLAAMCELNMSSVDDKPSYDDISDNLWIETDDKRRAVLSKITFNILEKFTNVRYNRTSDSVCLKENDAVCTHSVELLSMGLLYLHFRDAIKEGDGDRVLRSWRYFLPMLVKTGRKNYVKEALLFLCSVMFVPSPLSHRFVNTKGGAGHNIPADLHNEHLHRVCKTAVKSLGSNKTKKVFNELGKLLG